jgi:hypothetical protein
VTVQVTNGVVITTGGFPVGVGDIVGAGVMVGVGEFGTDVGVVVGV